MLPDLIRIIENHFANHQKIMDSGSGPIVPAPNVPPMQAAQSLNQTSPQLQPAANGPQASTPMMSRHGDTPSPVNIQTAGSPSFPITPRPPMEQGIPMDAYMPMPLRFPLEEHLYFKRNQ